MTRTGIAAGGNWIVDRVKLIDRYPAAETLANILSESRQNGGAPFSLLVDLAKLGAKFPLEGIGLIGSDADGEYIRAVCRENGIQDTLLSTVPDEQTSYTDVMNDRLTGQRTFFHHRGASANLAPEHFNFGAVRARHFHLGYLLLLSGLDAHDPEYGTGAARVLALARQHGLSTSIDVVSEDSDRFREVVLPSLPYVDVAFMNEIELSRTTGIQVRPDAEPEALARACDVLFDAGLQGCAAIHTAEQGYVRLKDGRDFRRHRAIVEHIAGTVGAGDAFAAGFLFARHEGHDVDKCLRWATAAAASSLLGEGASNGILQIAEALERFG